MAEKTKKRTEFGDYQTPLELAHEVCRRVGTLFGAPATVVEPTCGIGNFLLAAHGQFGSSCELIGVELNRSHLDAARIALSALGRGDRYRLLHEDFFGVDWGALLSQTRTPLLVVGNPPWVTNSQLGSLGSTNLPAKTNFQNFNGLDAVTGKSNFDISESMGIHIIENLCGRDATLAILIKVGVARKLLRYSWTRGLPIRDPMIALIDARDHFDAAVNACLFVCRTDRPGTKRCPVYKDLRDETPVSTLGIADGNRPHANIVAHIDAYRRTAALAGPQSFEWRSGIKHDCAKVLELRRVDGLFENGFGESVDVEPQMVYSLLKSSDVAKARLDSERWLIVPQKATGEDTSQLQVSAPKTWAYLNRHADRLDRRKSRIYRNRPRFSIFGVGPYTFTDWKIAISGLHKRLQFLLVPPAEVGQPVVFDDTVYLTPCATEAEARSKMALLSSQLAADFYSSLIFWDAKRPITARVLRQLDMARLAEALAKNTQTAG